MVTLARFAAPMMESIPALVRESACMPLGEVKKMTAFRFAICSCDWISA